MSIKRLLLCILVASLTAGCGKKLDYDKPEPTPSGYTVLNLELSAPGILASKIPEEEIYNVRELTLSGPLNGTDLLLIRKMAGADLYGEPTDGSLVRLDLAKAWFTEGGGEHYIHIDSDGERTHIRCSSGGIPSFAFCFCTKLNEIIFPEESEVVGSYAFYHCSSLDSILLPDSVIDVDRGAFDGCSALREINFPKGISALNDYLLYSCTSLERIDIYGDIKRIGYATFCNCPMIPTLDKTKFKYLESVGDYAFYGCKKLDTALFPSSQKRVPYGCFYDCSNITSFDFSGIEEIDGYAFTNTGLTGVSLPEGLVSIGDMAFGATKVKILVGHSPLGGELMLPKSLTYMGRGAFYWSGITKITIQSDISVNGDDINMLMYSHFRCPKLETVDVSDGVTFLELSFSGNLLTNVKLPASLKRIGYKNGIDEWEAYTFSGCNALENIDLPEGLEIMGSGIFSGCSSLKNINIPSSVKVLGPYTFRNCTSMTVCDLNINIDKVEQGLFEGCGSLQRISLPTSVTELGLYAFKGCTSLDRFTIPESVNIIGKECFSGCSSLSSIIIPYSVTELKDKTFSDCTSLTEIVFNGPVKSIMSECFSLCYSLKKIELPASINDIGDYAFYYCGALDRIDIPEGVTKIGAHTFDNCRALSSVKLPSSIQEIQGESFAYCVHLNEMRISAITPPSLSATAFSQTPINNAVLYVPSSSISKYKSTGGWNSFGSIVQLP